MAAQSTPSAPAPTARYVRFYLFTWGLLAAGGLAYLASLAWQPELFAQLGLSDRAEADSPLQLANRALTEVGVVRRTLDEVQRDVGQVREAMAERGVQERVVEARISALEERATTAPAVAAAQAPEPPAAEKSAEKAKADKPRKPGATPAAHVVQHRQGSPDIETGSIGAESPTITFGEPVVTPSRSSAYGVQLAAGPSLEAVRLSWNTLLERHGAELSALQPHVVPPRADGTGSYRLVAGPLPTRADADKLCNTLGVGRQGCFATSFLGQPL